VVLYNVSGRKIARRAIVAGENTLAAPAEAGAYMLSVTCAEGSRTAGIIVR